MLCKHVPNWDALQGAHHFHSIIKSSTLATIKPSLGHFLNPLSRLGKIVPFDTINSSCNQSLGPMNPINKVEHKTKTICFYRTVIPKASFV